MGLWGTCGAGAGIAATLAKATSSPVARPKTDAAGPEEPAAEPALAETTDLCKRSSWIRAPRERRELDSVWTFAGYRGGRGEGHCPTLSRAVKTQLPGTCRGHKPQGELASQASSQSTGGPQLEGCGRTGRPAVPRGPAPPASGWQVLLRMGLRCCCCVPADWPGADVRGACPSSPTLRPSRARACKPQGGPGRFPAEQPGRPETSRDPALHAQRRPPSLRASCMRHACPGMAWKSCHVAMSRRQPASPEAGPWLCRLPGWLPGVGEHRCPNEAWTSDGGAAPGQSRDA